MATFSSGSSRDALASGWAPSHPHFWPTEHAVGKPARDVTLPASRLNLAKPVPGVDIMLMPRRGGVPDSGRSRVDGTGTGTGTADPGAWLEKATKT